MKTVAVYENDEKIDECTIRLDFYVVEGLSGEIFWYPGEQEEAGRGGGIKVWVQGASTVPCISYVLPDWQLIIDGVKQDSKFYDGVENLGGKIVELQHKEYRFVFDFTV